MNLLIYSLDDLDDDGTLAVTGDRARHIREVLGVHEGSVIRAGALGGGAGEATVTALPPDGSVRLRPGPRGDPSPSAGVQLLVSLPRPQSLKKVLQLAGTFAVDRVVFCGGFRVEKSYFHSPVLNEARIRDELILGLEQGGSTWLPEVLVRERHRDLFEEPLHTLLFSPPGARFVAHPSADSRSFADRAHLELLASNRFVTIAIGPEGGFGRKELESFSANGFRLLSLGSRLLRVEHAVCAALAQLDLARQLPHPQ